jgi:putative ABC transport system permease protein
MEIGPIWRALLRNRTAYVLTALQIAVTMAIMVNAVAIVQERSRLMARASGIDEQNIFHLTSMPFAPDFDVRSSVTEDLDMLRRLPGVVSAIATNNVPLMGRGWSMSIQTMPGDDIEGTGVGMYFVDEQGIDTFGVNLTAGRNFRLGEVEWHEGNSHRWPPVGIISQATAETLWPEAPQDAVGKVVYIANDQPMTIVGIIDRFQAAWKIVERDRAHDAGAAVS